MGKRTRTWIELDLSGEGIAGRLHDEDHPPRYFSGWLELVAVLEEARARRVGTTSKAPVVAPHAGDAEVAQHRSAEASTIHRESECPSGS